MLNLCACEKWGVSAVYVRLLSAIQDMARAGKQDYSRARKGTQLDADLRSGSASFTRDRNARHAPHSWRVPGGPAARCLPTRTQGIADHDHHRTNGRHLRAL